MSITLHFLTMMERRNGKGRRRGRNPRNNRGGGNSQWQVQQTKVTVRNISTKFSTSAQILTMLAEMIQKVNAESSSNLPIKLDIKSVEKIIRDEDLIAADVLKGKEDDDTKEKEDETVDEAADVDMKDAGEQQEKRTMADIVRGPEVPEDGPFITARALYVNPARISRRRGEKNGCAYLVLTAPAPPPPPPKPVDAVVAPVEKDTATVADTAVASLIVETTSTAMVENETDAVVTVPADTEEAVTENKETATNEGEDKMEVDKDEVSDKTEAQTTDKNEPSKTEQTVESTTPKETIEEIKVSSPLYSPAEKTRLMSIAKLQLLQVIESLSTLAEQDAKTAQLYGNCEVAASINGKAWRDKESRDRREGTVEFTGDYKQFFAKQDKATEDRQNRPKPAPGGGLATGDNGDSDQQLSAIVLHLRSKHQEENKRKKIKKRVVKETTKGKASPAPASNNRDGKGRNNNNRSGSGGAGRGRSRPSNNNNKKKSDGGSSAPVVLKKAASNGSG